MVMKMVPRTKESLDQYLNSVIDSKLEEYGKIIDDLSANNDMYRLSADYKEKFLNFYKHFWRVTIIQRISYYWKKQGFSRWPIGNYIFANQTYTENRSKYEIGWSVRCCIVIWVILFFGMVPKNVVTYVTLLLTSAFLIRYGAKFQAVFTEMVYCGIGFPGIKPVLKLKSLNYREILKVEEKNIQGVKKLLKEIEEAMPKYYLSEDKQNILTKDEKIEELKKIEKGNSKK